MGEPTSGLQGLDQKFCQIKSVSKNLRIIMPTTPRMRKANEKNAKNITNRGNVSKSSKKRGSVPSITRAFSTLYFCCDWVGCLPNCSVNMDGLKMDTWKPGYLKMPNSHKIALLHLPLLFC